MIRAKWAGVARQAWRMAWALLLVGALAAPGRSPSTAAHAAATALVDVVYVGSANNTLDALDGHSGQRLWHVVTDGPVQGGLLVVGTTLYAQTYGSVYALDTISGDHLWTFPMSGCGAPRLSYLGGLTVADGVVYAPCASNALYALDAVSGARLWAVGLGGAINVPPAVGGGVLYVVTDDGNVSALDTRTGDPLWRSHMGGGASAPSLVGDTLYLGSRDGSVSALDARDGHRLWSFVTGGPVLSAPRVVGGVLYVGSDDDNVYAVDARTGAQLWSYSTGGAVRSSPVVAAGVVLVGSDDANLYALDARTGQRLWTFPTGGAVEASPAVVGGTIYAGSSDQTLYALSLRTGDQLWATPTGGAVYASPAVDRQTRQVRLALQRQRRPPTAADQALPPGGDAPYFRQTGHTLGEPFLSFWRRYGGLATFGYPLSEALTENGARVQYTERFRLEVINGAVTTGPLGRLLSLTRLFAPRPARPSTPDRLYFVATRHSLSGAFLTYWRTQHGALLLGAPISEVTQERGAPTGALRATQWFERGRLEIVPARGVVVASLGHELLTRRGWLP